MTGYQCLQSRRPPVCQSVCQYRRQTVVCDATAAVTRHLTGHVTRRQPGATFPATGGEAEGWRRRRGRGEERSRDGPRPADHGEDGGGKGWGGEAHAWEPVPSAGVYPLPACPCEGSQVPFGEPAGRRAVFGRCAEIFPRRDRRRRESGRPQGARGRERSEGAAPAAPVG